MKRLTFLFIALLIYSSSMSQCDKLFDFKEGSSWTWSNYDKKGKMLGKTIQSVEKMSINGSSRDAVVTVTSSDAKGKQTEPISMEMSCADGVISVDMKKFLPSEYFADGDSEITIDGNNLEIPESMSVGDRLPDGSVKMSMSGDSPMAMNVTVSITNRKVVSEENMNTPAGSFDCLVIEQMVSTKMMMSINMESKEWYSPGVGMVKSESYRKGKLSGYSILTTFTK